MTKTKQVRKQQKPVTKREFLKALQEMGACGEAIYWVESRGERKAEAIWNECPRVEWLRWLLPTRVDDKLDRALNENSRFTRLTNGFYGVTTYQHMHPELPPIEHSRLSKLRENMTKDSEAVALRVIRETVSWRDVEPVVRKTLARLEREKAKRGRR